MATEYRPDVIGKVGETGASIDPEKAIQKMEYELKDMALSLRKTRYDYVKGLISEADFEQVEARFADKLKSQRNLLQLLRSAAKGK